MEMLLGFAPWIVYWVLVGSVPFHTAVLVALGVSIASFTIGRVKNSPGRTLEVGALITFVVLTALTFTLAESFIQRWLQPMSNAGIFLVALVGVLIGKPFVRDFAVVGRPPEVTSGALFRRITYVVTWIWVVAFGGMTISSMIPPIAQGSATIRDGGSTLSIVCYWVIPITLMGVAAIASKLLPGRMVDAAVGPEGRQ